jgi:hypothetical protein
VVARKGESLWIKEIIEFFVSLVCVCSLVYCVIRGLETLTIISSPKANFLIWCHITWNVIITWQNMTGIGRDGTCNIIFFHATMCLFGTKWSLSEKEIPNCLFVYCPFCVKTWNSRFLNSWHMSFLKNFSVRIILRQLLVLLCLRIWTWAWPA